MHQYDSGLDVSKSSMPSLGNHHNKYDRNKSIFQNNGLDSDVAKKNRVFGLQSLNSAFDYLHSNQSDDEHSIEKPS